jgi:hypothetical protein
MGWLLWLIGVAIAVIVGLSVFAGYDVPYVVEQIKAFPDGAVKALFLALGLIALSKVVG